MLPRAALRALHRPSSISSPSSPLVLRRVLPPWRPSLRTFADNRPRRPPPPPTPSPASSSTRRARPPPPRDPYRTGTIRQTSPGTSIPKDQTWKAQDDSIRFQEPVAASSASASKIGDTTSKKDSRPVDGASDLSATSQSGQLDGDATQPIEPLAQKMDVDEPVVGSVREAAQRMQAEAENALAPSEPLRAAPAEEPIIISNTAQGERSPLPDLRQGIPSTFATEFGAALAKQQQSDAAAQRPDASQQQSHASSDKLDITYVHGESESHKREREDREYDRSAYETSLDRRRALVANWLYGGILAGVLFGALYLARPYSTSETIPTSLPAAQAAGWSPTNWYARVRARLGAQLGHYTEPTFPKLLPEVPLTQRPPFTLVLSLEDLLIHTTWDRSHGWRTAKRPGVDYFIRYLLPYYELVLFTSVPLAMADPVIKKLDPYHFIQWPLGREATKYSNGEYVKDLAYLNRDLTKTLIIDTHAPHIQNQPENAILLPKWNGDPKDPHARDLVALIPFLEYIATVGGGIEDVRKVLESFKGKDIPLEFARREAIAREAFNAERASQTKGRSRYGVGSLASTLGVKAGGMLPPAMAGGGGGGMGMGMVLADGTPVAEGLAQGKMLSDLIREQGQKQYEALEKQVRENGAQWLKEEEEEMKKAMEVQMREMKKGAVGWFGGRG